MHLTAAFALLAALVPLALGSVQDKSDQQINLSEIEYKEDSVAVPSPQGASGRRIHPDGRMDLCITVQGGEFALGAEIGIAYCAKDGTDPAACQQWDLKAAQAKTGGQIKITNPKDDKKTYCLAIGTDNQSAARPRLEECSDAAEAGGKGQGWEVTERSIKNQKSDCGAEKKGACNQCLDVRMDSAPFQGKNWASCRDIQTWSCAPNDEMNPHQKWTLMDPNGALSGSTPEKRSSWARAGRSA